MANTTASSNKVLPKFASLYLAYDDEALKTYANAGLLRRAKKDVTADKITLSDNTDDDAIYLTSDTQHVVLSDKGLVEAKCDCTSVSACKHIVASVLYVQAVMQKAQDTAKNEPTANLKEANLKEDKQKQNATKEIADTDPTAINQPNALDEILKLNLDDIQKIAKKIPKAKRLKAFSMALSYFDSFSVNHNHNDDNNESNEGRQGKGLDNTLSDAQSNTIIVNDTYSLTIQLANLSEPIRYIQGAGFAGMLSKIERDADSYHLLALLEVKRSYQNKTSADSPTIPQSTECSGIDNPCTDSSSIDNFETIKNWLSTTLQIDTSHNQTPYQAYQLPSATLAMLDDLTFDMHQLLIQGLSNIDSYAANRMHLNNTLARSHHLPRLAGQLRQLSGRIHDYSLGSMHASERQILLSLADLSAYIFQLKNSVGDKLIKLRGQLRQSYDNDAKRTELTLQPLGANWWHSDGKARGLTLYFYDPNERQIVELTQARAQAQDPKFDKYSAWYSAVWMTSASQLMHQTSTLYNPRFNENNDFGEVDFNYASNKLAVTGSRVTGSAYFVDGARHTDTHKTDDQTSDQSSKGNQTNFSAYLHSISAIAYDDWAQLEHDWRHQMAHDDGIAPVILLNPAKIGALLIDEIEQCVWWQLQDGQDNQIRLRLDWNSNEHTSIAKIKKLERLNLHDIQMIVASVRFDNGTSSNRIELNPVSLVMQSDLFHLDYDDVPNKKHTLKDLLSGRISKLMSKKRRLTEIQGDKPTTLTQHVCEPILDVLDSLCSCGRLQPTGNQINTLRQQHKLASDAGLSVLAKKIESVFTDALDDSIDDTAKTQDKNRLQPILKLAYLCKQLQLLQIEMPIFLNS